MKNKIIVAIIVIFMIIVSMITFSKWKKGVETQKMKSKINTEMNIVTSLEDPINENTAWCGTFNLIWNDLKKDLAKQDIVFSPQLEKVQNLNKGTFNTSHLSENSYYKVYGTPTLELKSEIEKNIQKKFNETSDILNDFDWNNKSSEDYFLYAMLKKEFEFPNVFTELKNGKFGNYQNVKYFGIDDATDEKVREQVEVLYYNSKKDFAVKLFTKSNDEVIISRGEMAQTFGEMYEEIQEKSENYQGNSNFGKQDILQIPNIYFDLKEEFKELENQPFLFSNGESYEIEKALQTIKFELDKKGGKIKSEAGMMIAKSSAFVEAEPREFIVDDVFTIFLVEEDRDLPYFASQISDISKVQDDVIK